MEVPADGPAGPGVPGWDRYRDWHQQLRLRVGAPAAEVLDALASGLAGERFKVRDRGPDGFTVRHVDWFAVLAQKLDSTTLRVSAKEAAGGTEVTVAVVAGGEHRSGQRHAARGLTAAVATLRGRGRAVAVSDWRPVGR